MLFLICKYRRIMTWTCGAVLCGSMAIATEPEAPSDPAPRWLSERSTFNGPELSPEWFAERRVVVYLLPTDGDVGAFRRAASAIMKDQWTGGDWSLKHVFVSDVPNRLRFAARTRIAIYDVALQITAEAGQPAEFAFENEPFVRDHVFFVHDPQGSLWDELLTNSKRSEREQAILFLDYGGRVVKAIDPTTINDGTERIGETPSIAVEARKLLPRRTDLGG